MLTSVMTTMIISTSVVENNADSDFCYGENDNSDVCDDGNVSALVN